MGCEENKRRLALELVACGLRAQEEGDLQKAVELFEASLKTFPTAEGHTYLGWALSYAGRLDEAIAHCREAIKIDPEFGNPYNDIGVYLMQQRRLDEAIPWLERAKMARRYEPRHFPFINLASIYVWRGELRRAIEQFKGALALVPGDERIASAISQLESKLN
jgi:tetratricopeptide (TPR) repeat protein